MWRLACCLYMAACGAACAATPLQLVVTPEVHDGTVLLVGATNLPEGTQFMAHLRRPESGYSASTKVAVQGGKLRAGPFSAGGKALPPGKYAARLTTPDAGVQPPAVRSAVGPGYSAFRGPMVKTGSFGKAECDHPIRWTVDRV